MARMLVAVGVVLACAGAVAGCGAQPAPGSVATATVTVTSTPTPSATPSTEVVAAEESPGDDVVGDVPGEALTRAEPANPVPIMRKITGCIPEGEARLGEHDVYGNRYVSCQFHNNGDGGPGTDVTVRTYLGDPRMVDAESLMPDDSHDVILGPDFSVMVTGARTEGRSPMVDVRKIAEQVGGELVQVKD